jgi:hypothetical protein
LAADISTGVCGDNLSWAFDTETGHLDITGSGDMNLTNYPAWTKNNITIRSVSFPDSITSIGDIAFEACSSLEDINIPDGVRTIGQSAFRICSTLESITIPKSVISIGKKAFQGCTNLIKIYCLPATPPAGGEDMFVAGSTLIKIYVDDDSLSAYQRATYWMNYASYYMGHDFY